MEYSEAEKQMLREVLPGIAVQLRGALANIHGALGRLAPERLRDRDTGTDRSAAILCQSCSPAGIGPTSSPPTGSF